MKEEDEPGIGNEKFELIFKKNWQQNNFIYFNEEWNDADKE